MLKLQVHIYLYEIQVEKHERKGSRRQAEYQSLDDTISASSPEKTSASALGSQYKSNGTIILTSSAENNHKKVTFIGSVRTSCHSTLEGRFKFSYLDIFNSFCILLLTFLLICTLKVSFKHQTILLDYTSLKIFCIKCLWSLICLFAWQ